MANVLKMANIQAILSLHAAGWKQNRIAAELDLDPETVRKYVRQHLCGPKPANAPTGSDDPKPAEIAGPPGSQPKPAENAPTGSTTQIHAPEPAITTVVASPAANLPRGPASQCEPYRETIQVKLDAGLSIQRIHQDLAGEGIAVHYDALRRYARRLNRVRPLPFRRLECQPGEEAQADFGSGAPVIGADGKRRKTHVFRVVLSYSRKGYSEVTFRQTTDDFLRALENAFRSFGGVPRTLVRIFNQRWEQVAIHVRCEPGRFQTHGEHVAAEKISGLERGAGYLLTQISLIGPQAHQWAQAMVTARGIAGTRVLQGLLSLRKKHSSEALENACKTALSHGVYRLKTVRELLKRKAETTHE